LGLIPNDVKALKLAEKALGDDKPEVRSAAAAALGDMKSRTSIPKLRKALDDRDPSVALTAAHSLELMHDDSAYEVYYEVLTGQRKAGKGLIASETSVLKDPKKMAQLGFEEGIGFIPFAGIGWEAIKVNQEGRLVPSSRGRRQGTGQRSRSGRHQSAGRCSGRQELAGTRGSTGGSCQTARPFGARYSGAVHVG
jgi:hypothetical protein